MSYTTIAQCANDSAFIVRITSAIAQEQVSRGESVDFSDEYTMRWAVSAHSDVEAAYASALAAENPSPGGDPSVITDGMILSAVQANWPEPPAVEE